jgi:hypothetical protein
MRCRQGGSSRAGRDFLFVIAGLDPAIHPQTALLVRWIPGSSPRMTSVVNTSLILFAEMAGFAGAVSRGLAAAVVISASFSNPVCVALCVTS